MYEENKAEVVQGTERLEAKEDTKQTEAVWICRPHKFVERYINKKGKRSKRLKSGGRVRK